jgi:hypothetical protein
MCCDECKKCLPIKTDRQQHIKEHANITGVKLFECRTAPIKPGEKGDLYWDKSSPCDMVQKEYDKYVQTQTK